MMPFDKTMVRNTILQMVNEWQKSKLTSRMEWPAQSPDLNPIANMGHIIKTGVSERQRKTNYLYNRTPRSPYAEGVTGLLQRMN
jgi:hypothetical protein